MVTKQDVRDIVNKLIHYKGNMYNLDPVDLADYIKLKNSLVSKGVVITDNKLTMPKSQLVDEIYLTLQQRATHDRLVSKVDVPVVDAFKTDISDIDEARTEIRKQLFNEDIVVKVTHSGRMFSIQWNGKMTTCKVNVPSGWKVSMEQSMLLDMYQQDIHTSAQQKENTNSMTKLGKFVFDLLSRHTDYSVIKRIVELEFESANSVYTSDIDKRRLVRLESKGFTLPVASLLLALVEQVSCKCFSSYAVKQILGFRQRLITEFEYLVNSASKSAAVKTS